MNVKNFLERDIMDIRILEKSKKMGYIFDISYRGTSFDAFDEMAGKTTVKGYFKEIMNSLGFTWAKGIQQGGRTDAKVSGNNCLYVSSAFSGNVQKIVSDFNQISGEKLKVTRVRKTLPNLIFPDYAEGRKYIYRYPQKKILKTPEEIEKTCREISGTYDVSRFTDAKGKELKEHIRTVNVVFENGELIFTGDSFMPKQVRIMSGYLLTGELTALPGKFLTLEKVILKEEILKNIFIEDNSIKIENVEKIERTEDKSLYIFYVSADKKGEVIGKNGGNIKKLRKEYGTIIVREI